MRRESCCVGFDEGRQYGPAVRLELSKAEALTTVLCRALCDESQFGYMIPEEMARLRFLPALFRRAIRASRLSGEIHTTYGIDGGALWIGPGSDFTIASMMTEARAVPFTWDWASLRRCVNLVAHLDKVHQQLVRGQHWYLLALGVEPSKQNGKVGETLIEPLLARADSDELPCYLETFNVRSLAFYERYGFRIAGGGKIPRGGPDFWAMIRPPQPPRL